MKTIDVLKTTLRNYPSEFARGCSAREPLAGFATPRDLLSALALTGDTSPAARDAITLALIAQHQEAAHPLWQSLLLVAYEPMLAHLFRWVRNARTDARSIEDAEARVYLAFLEAIQKVSLAHPPSLLALHLRHATERSVFGGDIASKRGPETVPLSAVTDEPALDSPSDGLEADDERRRLVDELERMFGADAPLVLDMLVHARTGRESLLDLIVEWHPQMRLRDRLTIYDRWQRLRRRALSHLEARFGSNLDRAVSAA